MRTLEASRQRWNVLFDGEKPRSDLWQAVRDVETKQSPCEDGLRSVCWKAFLLYGVLGESWPKKLSDSRGAYKALYEHFLRYIDHPHDLQSMPDPLTDDLSSPWSTLRQDEVNRGEICQDVKRCMQDMSFFQEPSTQKTLLNILFIYSKLHPDLGYRQGMHELLAPILWVVHGDAIQPDASQSDASEDKLMLDILDEKYVEHDTFALFCAVMQTEKASYEIGDSTSPIVERSRRIHDDYLAQVDPKLATHLRQIEILPQIFLLRWIRLLFGREFGLKETLPIWDVLFTESLNPSLVDMTCLAMLLRIRKQLLRARYAEALQQLLRYEPPLPPDSTRTLMRDAMFLDQNRNLEGGAAVIARTSGLKDSLPTRSKSLDRRPPSLNLERKDKNWKTLSRSATKLNSGSNSPGRFLSPPGGLANLIHEVPGMLQKQTENWKVSGAVRGAVGEVRRNMNNFQAGSPQAKGIFSAPQTPTSGPNDVQHSTDALRRRLSALQQRNTALAGMLGEVLEELRAQEQSRDTEQAAAANDQFNLTLARLQFVQIYLADSETPILDYGLNSPPPSQMGESEAVGTKDSSQISSLKDSSSGSFIGDGPKTDGRVAVDQNTTIKNEDSDEAKSEPKTLSPQARPTLAQSPLSWILGEGHHRSDFVTFSTPPPEERRDSIPKPKPKRLFPEEGEDRDGPKSEDDGFTMSSLDGCLSKKSEE